MLKKSFVHYKESWYAQYKVCPGIEDNVIFSVETEDKTAEFTIEWFMLCNTPVARFKSFDDTWWALPYIFDVLSWVLKKEISPEEFCQKLLSLGYEDITKRTDEI